MLFAVQLNLYNCSPSRNRGLLMLSDKEIKSSIKSGKILLSPFDENLVGVCSVDIRLGVEIREFRTNGHKDFFNPFERIQANDYTSLLRPEHGKFILEPGGFVLATSLERIRLPCNIAGRLEGRSSIGRLGIILFGGHIDPGFEGHLTLKIANISAMPIALYPEMRIAHILFEEIASKPSIGYSKRKSSKYKEQKGPVVSRIYKDTLNGIPCHG